MATLDDQGRPILTIGQPEAWIPTETYLCADLYQVRTAANGTYDVKRRSDNVVVGNTAVPIEDVELLGG